MYARPFVSILALRDTGLTRSHNDAFLRETVPKQASLCIATARCSQDALQRHTELARRGAQQRLPCVALIQPDLVLVNRTLILTNPELMLAQEQRAQQGLRFPDPGPQQGRRLGPGLPPDPPPERAQQGAPVGGAGEDWAECLCGVG